MKSNKWAPVAIPILIIIVGLGWLLTAQGVTPEVNWVWTTALAAVGIVTFVVSGVDKASVVIGPFFLMASLLSVLRQTNQLRFDVEVPLLVIGIGIFSLIAQLPAIPKPKWYDVKPSSATDSGPPKKLRLQDSEPPGDDPNIKN